MTTGILGGSFNPIHLGHTHMASSVLSEGQVKEVWLMVSPLNPLKRDDPHLLPYAERLSLARLAVEGMEGVSVSDFEASLPRPTYTALTLRALSRSFPSRQFALIIGADNWKRMPLWREGDWIVEHFPIIVVPRPGYPLQARQLPKGVTLARTPMVDISSTGIRQRIADGSYDGRDLLPRVWQEIQARGYYKA